jgi:predicted permease
VGQLVAEAVRFYGNRFWASLALGVPPALLVVAEAPLRQLARLVLLVTAGTILLTVSYVAACALVARERRGSLRLAFAVGALVFLPVPILTTAFVLPGLAWLALFGLAVPAVLVEGREFRAAFRRGIELARADYVHALGSLATLVIVVFLSQGVLFFLLRGAGEAAVAIAGFLASLVISPLLFLGAALLYDDQAARVRSSKRDGALPRRKPRASGPVRHPSSR